MGKDTKLFAIDAPKGSGCSCGANPQTMFVIANSKSEAKRLAKERKNPSDVSCGECMAKRIVAQGLVVADPSSLKHSEIKLTRVPVDVRCCAEGCGKSLPFGTWAHFNADTGAAICVECGAKRGWTDKARAVSAVKMLELKEDIKSLRKRYKIEAEGLYLLEEKIDLHQVTQNYQELEARVNGALSQLQGYLTEGIASPHEAEILRGLEQKIHELQDVAGEIKREFDNRLFLLDRAERQRKMLQKVFEDSDAETEFQRAAESAKEASQ